MCARLEHTDLTTTSGSNYQCYRHVVEHLQNVTAHTTRIFASSLLVKYRWTFLPQEVDNYVKIDVAQNL